MKKEETSSPTVYLENIMLTSVIDAKEDRDLVTIDIPNFFIQTPIDRKTVEEKIIMNLKGLLVDILVHVDLVKFGPNVFYEKGKKLL